MGSEQAQRLVSDRPETIVPVAIQLLGCGTLGKEQIDCMILPYWAVYSLTRRSQRAWMWSATFALSKKYTGSPD
jgi:hypothetical protein